MQYVCMYACIWIYMYIIYVYLCTYVCMFLQAEASSDPNVLKGTPCCPGVVTGTIRVVHSITEASVRQCLFMYVY